MGMVMGWWWWVRWVRLEVGELEMVRVECDGEERGRGALLRVLLRLLLKLVGGGLLSTSSICDCGCSTLRVGRLFRLQGALRRR